MVLSTEVILTLQQLDGVGNKTIFKLANQVSAPIYNFLTSSLRHPKRQDGQTMASMTDVRVSAS